MVNLTYLSLSEAGDLLRRRELTSLELTHAALDRIDKIDDKVCAFLLKTPEIALEQARQADEQIQRDLGGPLTGVPMALKDIMSTAGVRTTCGSRILENYVPQYTATAVERLFDAGAVLLGQTKMDEFAMATTNENSAFGAGKYERFVVWADVGSSRTADSRFRILWLPSCPIKRIGPASSEA